MRTRRTAGFEWLLLFGVGWLAWAAPAIVYGQIPTREFIVDILTTPNKYWNKSVIIKGHVRSVTANPPGTNRGSYVMRDSTDADITVLTTELPAMGKEYTVNGNVEQLTPDDKVPVLREVRRVVGTEAPLVAPPRRPASQETDTEPVRKTTPAAAPAPPPVTAQPAAPLPAPASAKEAPPVSIPVAPPAEGAAIPWPMIVTIAGLVVLLVVILFALMHHKTIPAPAAPVAYAPPPPTPGTQPAHVKPVAPPPSAARQAAAATAGRGVPTQAVPQPTRAVPQPTQAVPPPAGKATEVFMELHAELTVTDGPDRDKCFNLTKPAINIGRSGGRLNEVTLSDSTVSREHARILYSSRDKTFQLINESATNPARLNGNPVDKAILKDSDTIQLGATILRFKQT
jgi:hypothetical protein